MNIATLIVLLIVLVLCTLSIIYTKKNGIACVGNCANCKRCKYTQKKV